MGSPFPELTTSEELARLCQQLEPIPELHLQELAEATDYAVQIRYDLEIWPSQQEARQALALAEQVVR